LTIEIVTDNEKLASWFSEKSGDDVYPAGSQFFGLVRNGKIESVFVFGRFMGADAEMGVFTLPGCQWPRAFLWLMSDYAFRQCGLARVTLHAKDETAARMMERIGAVREGGWKKDFYGPGKPALAMVVFPEAYKLRQRNERT
jgi:hypothetical protein